jgi:hypothetical protein
VPVTEKTKLRFNQIGLSPFVWSLVLLFMIVLLTAVGPAEKSLGVNVRVVYLHGAWVWTSMLALIGAGVAGLAAIITQRKHLHSWSRVLGWTGLLFWITYLPISVWAMQTNWNGLYLSEPRWRLALIFGISGLLLQVGLALIDNLNWTSAANLTYIGVLLITLSRTQEVMHPRSPILQSDSRLIQAYFAALLVITLLLAWQVARAWYRISDIHTEMAVHRRSTAP